MTTKNCLQQASPPHLIKQVRKWGDITSNAVLDPSCKIFTTATIEGLIGYKEEAGYAIVLGDPICAPEDKIKFANFFKEFCHFNKCRVIYAITSEEFTKDFAEEYPAISLEFGRKFIFDPSHPQIQKTGVKASLVRRKIKHALNEHVQIQEYLYPDPKLENAIAEVGKNWLKSMKGPQIHIANLSLFSNRFGKRWFYAKQEENIIGVLTLNRLESKNGWLLNNLITLPNAAHGTSELLMTTVLETLREENCTFLTVGPIPYSSPQKIEGLGLFSSWLIKGLFTIANKIFHLNQHSIFWEKFQPERQEKCYLVFEEKIRFSSIRALMKILNADL